jgi:hypothetical protein
MGNAIKKHYVPPGTAHCRYNAASHIAGKDKTMMIDTQIRHITPPGANLFAELGFAADEAAQFQAELQHQIEQARTAIEPCIQGAARNRQP